MYNNVPLIVLIKFQTVLYNTDNICIKVVYDEYSNICSVANHCR